MLVYTLNYNYKYDISRHKFHVVGIGAWHAVYYMMKDLANLG